MSLSKIVMKREAEIEQLQADLKTMTGERNALQSSADSINEERDAALLQAKNLTEEKDALEASAEESHKVSLEEIDGLKSQVSDFTAKLEKADEEHKAVLKNPALADASLTGAKPELLEDGTEVEPEEKKSDTTDHYDKYLSIADTRYSPCLFLPQHICEGLCLDLSDGWDMGLGCCTARVPHWSQWIDLRLCHFPVL